MYRYLYRVLLLRLLLLCMLLYCCCCCCSLMLFVTVYLPPEVVLHTTQTTVVVLTVNHFYYEKKTSVHPFSLHSLLFRLGLTVLCLSWSLRACAEPQGGVKLRRVSTALVCSSLMAGLHPSCTNCTPLQSTCNQCREMFHA